MKSFINHIYRLQDTYREKQDFQVDQEILESLLSDVNSLSVQ